MFRKTIAKSISIRGIGVFCGREINVKLCPSSSGTGIRIIRDDIKEHNIFQVDRFAKYDTEHLNTTILNDKNMVKLVEHLISAIWCFKITDMDIHTDCDELPMLDGSACGWVKLFESAGIKEFEEKKDYKYISKEVKYEEVEKYIIAKPCDHLRITYTIDFDEKTIGKNSFTFDENLHSYVKELSYARTFCTEKQVDNHIKIKKAFTNDDIIIFGDDKILSPSNTGLRYSNEATRHKVLDLIGDLTSSGDYICGEFICYKTGHFSNRKLLDVLYGEKDILISRD